MRKFVIWVLTKCVDNKTKCVEIRMQYWFPNMQSKVEQFIQNCLKCIIYSVPPHNNNRTLHPIPKKPIPFDTVHIYTVRFHP